MNKSVYQVKITLKRFKPKIWRRVLVPPDLLLSDFHKVIQTAMGWENAHLHQFIKGRTFYTRRLEDDDFWGTMDNVDYTGLIIRDLLKGEKESIDYEYDFGDGWEHEVLLEKILPAEDNVEYPVCIGGKMNCPPEDCGGPWGYAQLLEIIRDPEHDEYAEYMEWLGGEFDPDAFNMEEVNRMLQERDFGCLDLYD